MKKLAAVLFGSCVVGVGVGLIIGRAVGQQPSDDMTTASADMSKSDTSTSQLPSDPPTDNSAIRVRKNRPGAMTKTRHFENPATVNLRRMTTFQGTVVSNATTAAGQAIAAAFKNLDPKAPERMNHFAWVGDTPQLNPVGWDASITRIEPFPGGWQVEIHVAPIFAPAGGSVTLADWCVERWLYQGGVLQQVPFPHTHRASGPASLVID